MKENMTLFHMAFTTMPQNVKQNIPTLSVLW